MEKVMSGIIPFFKELNLPLSTKKNCCGIEPLITYTYDMHKKQISLVLKTRGNL